MSNLIKHFVDIQNIDDENNFIKIEEYILEFGLKAFMVVNGDLEKPLIHSLIV